MSKDFTTPINKGSEGLKNFPGQSQQTGPNSLAEAQKIRSEKYFKRDKAEGESAQNQQIQAGQSIAATRIGVELAKLFIKLIQKDPDYIDWKKNTLTPTEMIPINLSIPRFVILLHLQSLSSSYPGLNLKAVFDNIFVDKPKNANILLGLTYHTQALVVSNNLPAVYKNKMNNIVVMQLHGMQDYDNSKGGGSLGICLESFYSTLAARMTCQNLVFLELQNTDLAHLLEKIVRSVMTVIGNLVYVVPRSDNTKTEQNVTRRGHNSPQLPVGSIFYSYLIKLIKDELLHGIFTGGTIEYIFEKLYRVLFGPTFSPMLCKILGTLHAFQMAKLAAKEAQHIVESDFNRDFPQSPITQHVGLANGCGEEIMVSYLFSQIATNIICQGNERMRTFKYKLRDRLKINATTNLKLLDNHQKVLQNGIELLLLFCLFLETNGEYKENLEYDIISYYIFYESILRTLGRTIRLPDLKAEINKTMDEFIFVGPLTTKNKADIANAIVARIKFLLGTQGTVGCDYKDPENRTRDIPLWPLNLLSIP